MSIIYKMTNVVKLNEVFRYLYFVLMLLTYFSANCQSEFVVRLHGSIWNDSTAQKIPIEVFKRVDGNIYKISKSQPNGDFTADISKDTETIVFTLGNEGKQFSIPVVFYGEFQKPISATFSLNVSPDNLRQSFDIVALILGKPTTPATKYAVQHFRGDDLHCEIEESARSMRGIGMIDQIKNIPPDNNSHYILKLSDSNQQNVSKVNYRKHNGIVFVDTNIYKTERETDQGSGTINEDIFKIVTFDQSGYDINDSELPKLDSIVSFCKVHPNKFLEIRGFTDGVGDSQKNATLAMYRTKVVRNYLLTYGISENRIKFDWEKTNAVTARTNNLEQFRKVEIKVK
jgi:outer membrane protein OmpA-like peptidoglycan-associated protein